MVHPDRRPARRPVGRLAIVWLALALASAAPAVALAQSTAVNGTIEGTVQDASGGVLPGVTVTVTSVDTGAQRTVVTNERGSYRAPLLPLGTYSLVAELDGFKRHEELGIALAAGQTAVINVSLTIGSLEETVTVTGETPVVDAGRIDVGRNISTREIKNLPLVSRNPYNFALLQPGVTGYENPEFGVPRFSANGTLLRINYQIDGNTNTQKDRAGLRLVPMSEVMISEVKVVTSGYAPEFGQSMGVVYNAITPSGTNTVRGAASFRFRRKPFSAFPFFFQGPKTDETKPDTKIDTWTGELGGPIVRDKLHYYVGYERTYRDMSQRRIITIDPAVAEQVGLSPQPPFVPFNQTVHFPVGKIDYQLSQGNRLMVRFLKFRNEQPGNAGGGLTSIERTYDYHDDMNSFATQLISTIADNKLNELRFQYANRHTSRTLSEYSGSGQQIGISGQVTFGKPFDIPSEFKQGILQILDNFSWMRGDHAFKFGADMQVVWDWRASSITHDGSYTFPDIPSYLAAVSGQNPYGYTRFSQTLGNPYYEFDSKLFSGFVQDDWRVTPAFKVLYGVRYDLYVYPKAKADSPFEYSRDFAIDKNNVAPRLGVAWTIGDDGRTVLRASSGVMYDQAILGAYENAIQQNGEPERLTISCAPAAGGCPAFPNALTDLPPGYKLPVPNIFTVDPDFKVAHTLQNNVQIERGLGKDLSVAVGFIFSKGYDLPVVNNINVINPIGTLEDGRPVFSTAVNANTRMDPRFNQIQVVESIGESTYKGLTLQFTRRAPGLQFDLTYSFGKGEDNAPASGNLSFISDGARSDPTNLDRDKGPNRLDSRHSFAGSVVAQPSVNVDNAFLHALLNNNQLALMIQLNSGLPFQINGNRDLNGDGSGSDRPLFVGRNSMYMPNRYNVDARYSRYVPIRGSMRLEIIGECKNVFNTVQVSGLTSTVQVNTSGQPLASLPTDPSGFPYTSGYEQRQFQLGFKFHF